MAASSVVAGAGLVLAAASPDRPADYGLDATAASHILGQAVRYDVANVFNPAYSVACRLAKRWRPQTGAETMMSV